MDSYEPTLGPHKAGKNRRDSIRRQGCLLLRLSLVPRLYWETEWLRLGVMLSHPFPWDIKLKVSVLCTNAGPHQVDSAVWEGNASSVSVP